MRELWKPIPNYEGFYEVSDHGRVRSLDREIHVTPTVKAAFTSHRKGRVLRQIVGSHGYLAVYLSRDGKVDTVTVHRLVAHVFHGPPPDPSDEAAHLDGDRCRNVPSNLAWVSRKENEAHKLAHGTLLRGEACPWAKLTPSQVDEIRTRCRRGEIQRLIAAEYGVSQSTVSLINLGKNWRAA